MPVGHRALLGNRIGTCGDLHRSEPTDEQEQDVRSRKVLALVVGAAVALVLLGGPVSAHVYFEETEGPAGGYALLTMDVPHGCGGSRRRR